MWVSPGLREHEDEFRKAWVAHFGPQLGVDPNAPAPKGTYKAWYKQWKKTGIGPADWIRTLGQGPPKSGVV